MKRICLFAGYDANNIIQDYVIQYITELSKIADVYYMSDNSMANSELLKLNKITKKAFSMEHKKYDFGSYQELIGILGWEEIEKYDQLLLVNDSCYGPLFDLTTIFNSCESKYDFWGITGVNIFSYHIQSYFLVMNKEVTKNFFFRSFFQNIKQKMKHIDIIHQYEIGLSKLIQAEGFRIGTYAAQENKRLDLTINPVMAIEHYKIPLVKIKVLTGEIPSMNLYNSIIKTIKNLTNYDVALIEKHILSKGTSLSENKVKVFLQLINTRIFPSWFFIGKITKRGNLLIKILKIPIFNFRIKW